MSDAIRLAYRENAARLLTPVGRVVLLYEQLIHDIGRARAAIHGGQIEARSEALNHALLVLGVLQGSLDLERGGEVARNLDRFYTLVRNSLINAQIQSSAKILEDQRDLLLSLRAAWVEVERVEDQNKRSSMVPKASSAEPSSGTSSKDWRA
jgi:flagellar protein FliS